MTTLKNLGLTALLILIQPVKLAVSVAGVALAVSYDVGREFVADARSIWRRP